jgi:hypothetical protein
MGKQRTNQRHQLILVFKILIGLTPKRKEKTDKNKRIEDISHEHGKSQNRAKGNLNTQN